MLNKIQARKHYSRVLKMLTKAALPFVAIFGVAACSRSLNVSETPIVSLSVPQATAGLPGCGVQPFAKNEPGLLAETPGFLQASLFVNTFISEHVSPAVFAYLANMSAQPTPRRSKSAKNQALVFKKQNRFSATRINSTTATSAACIQQPSQGLKANSRHNVLAKVFSNTVPLQVTPVNANSDGALSAANGVIEPVSLATTVNSPGEAVEVFDFTLSDGGGGDGLEMEVLQVVLRVGGSSTDAERQSVTWRLNGADANNVVGSYNSANDTLIFSGLAITVADGDADTYTVNAYFNNNAAIADGHTFVLSVDGDTDLTLASSGRTQMGSTEVLSNGVGGTWDVAATRLVLRTQPAGLVSGRAMSTQPVVEARDVFGNLDIDFNEMVTATDASGESTLTNYRVAAVSGVATFTELTSTSGSDGQRGRIVFSGQNSQSKDLTSVESLELVTDVVASELVFSTLPAGSVSGEKLSTQPVVHAVGPNGVVDTDFNQTITLSEMSAGNLSGNSVIALAGVAAFTDLSYSASADRETFTINAAVSGINNSNGLTTVNAPPLVSDVVATRLMFDTQPAPNTFQANGSPQSFTTTPVVSARDSAGILDSDFSAAISLTLAKPSDNSLDGSLLSVSATGDSDTDITTASMVASAGKATFSGLEFDYQPRASDNVVFRATAAGVAAANSNVITIFDSTAPTLLSSVPLDNATAVAKNTELRFRFSEPIKAGGGTVDIYRADGSLQQRFSVADANINNNVNSNSASFELDNDLLPGQAYYVLVATNAFTDIAGNAFAGLNNADDLNFTVRRQAPVANNDSASVNEDNAVAIDVLQNDWLGDSPLNMASVLVLQAPANGRASVNTGTGVITYTPNANYHGSDTFTYTVGDISGVRSNAATVAINIQAQNDAPIANADLVNIEEDTRILLDLAANDTDIDTGDSPDPSSIALVTLPGHGTAQLQGGQVLYLPDTNFNGSDRFTYTIADQTGASSNIATVTLNVGSINDAPIARDDSANLDEDTQAVIEVLNNDKDIDGSINPASVQVMLPPSHGQLIVNAQSGVVVYTPKPDFYGEDRFSYLVQDEAGASSNIATVRLSINSINDAPRAVNDTVVLLEDRPHEMNVLGNDSDIDGSLVPSSLEVLSLPQNGSLQIDASNGMMTFTPGANFNGADQFTYRVQDNAGAFSAPATVQLTVNAVNDKPLANNDSASTDEDVLVDIDVLSNDSDIDNGLDPNSLEILAPPALGSVSIDSSGMIRYLPNDNLFGHDSFTYRVRDTTGEESNIATVHLTIRPVNDAPSIGGTPANVVLQGESYRFIPVVEDIDENDTLSFHLNSQPHWLNFNSETGELSGVPGNSDVGLNENLVISVSDGMVSVSLAPFNITVVNVNDAPLAKADSYQLTEGGQLQVSAIQGVLANDLDRDSDTLTIELMSSPQQGELSLFADGGFIYTHRGNESRNDYFTYLLNDGQVRSQPVKVNLMIAPVNDAPQFTTQAPRNTLAQGDTFRYEVGVTDPDSTVQLRLIEGPSWLSLSEQGVLQGEAPFIETTYSVLLRVFDGEFTVDQAFNLRVLPREAPVVNIDTQWQTLPAQVGDTVLLNIALAQAQGTPIDDGRLHIVLGGQWQALQVPNCEQVAESEWVCAVTTAPDAVTQIALQFTPAAPGDRVVKLQFYDTPSNQLVASAVTDLSVSEQVASQANQVIAAENVSALASIDLFGDNQPYLIVGTGLGQDVQLIDYRAQANNNFQDNLPIVVSRIANRGFTESILAEDINADGLPDVLVVNSQGDSTNIYYNLGDTEFATWASRQTLPHATRAQFIDLNRDTFPELVLGGDGENIYVYRNHQGEFDTPPYRLTLPFAVNHFAILTPDLEEAFAGRMVVAGEEQLALFNFALLDPDQSVARLNDQAEKNRALSENKTAETQGDTAISQTLSLLSTLELPGISSLKLADINGDASQEVLLSYQRASHLLGATGVGIVSVDANSLQVAAQVGRAGAYQVSVADFNNDQAADLLVANQNKTIQFFSGNGQLDQWQLSATSIFQSSTLAMVDDTNSDKLDDVIIFDGLRELGIYTASAGGKFGVEVDLQLSSALNVSATDAFQFDYIFVSGRHGFTRSLFTRSLFTRSLFTRSIGSLSAIATSSTNSSVLALKAPPPALTCARCTTNKPESESVLKLSVLLRSRALQRTAALSSMPSVFFSLIKPRVKLTDSAGASLARKQRSLCCTTVHCSGKACTDKLGGKRIFTCTASASCAETLAIFKM